MFYIGMPFAFDQAGILMGGLQLLFISIITDYSLILMIKCGELSGARSYQVLTNFFISIAIEEKKYDSIVLYHLCLIFFSCFQGMMEKAFGRIGFFILTFIQFVYPFIGMIFFISGKCNVFIGLGLH